MSKLTDALSKLDPANDNHWTAEGFPRIETVRMLAADQSITRDSITAEAPNLTRQSLLTPPPPVAPPVAPTQEVKAVTEAGSLESATKDAEVLDYTAMIAEGQQFLQEAIKKRDEAQAVVNRIQNKLDELINKQQESGQAETNADAITAYLRSQQAELDERARRSKVLRDSGVTLNDIKALIPQVSPLDQALAKKR